MSLQRPDERTLDDLTPDEVAAVQAALTAKAAGMAAQSSLPDPTVAATVVLSAFGSTVI